MFELQTAVVTALKASAAVQALLGADARVYDDHPVDIPVMPYVTVGEFVTAPFDTKTSIGREATVSLHVWSSYRGRKEAEQVLKAIYDVLHRQTLTVSGYSFILGQFIGSESFIDADGITRHGVCRFRFTLDQ